jgi:hypothetical protein
MSRPNGGGAMPGGREMTRAERFEEEKRRIVDSCFNKKDVDGSCVYTLPLTARWLPSCCLPCSSSVTLTRSVS